MNESISGTFLSQGVLGAIILVLAGVIIFLYRENKLLQAENAGLRDRLLQKAEDYATKVLDLSNQVLTTVRQLNDLFSSKKQD